MPRLTAWEVLRSNAGAPMRGVTPAVQRVGLDARDVAGVLVLEDEAGTEGVDDHLEARNDGLVDGGAERGGRRGSGGRAPLRCALLSHLAAFLPGRRAGRDDGID